MKELERKSVLITGAALGLGRELTLQLSKFNCKFHLLDIRGPELESLQHELQSRGVESQIYIVDLADRDISEDCIVKIKQHEKIDILILNAAIVNGGFFAQENPKQHERIFQINYFSPIQFFRSFMPDLQSKSQSNVIVIASIAGFIGLPFAASYSASKWALIGYFESAKHELIEAEKSQIKIGIVCPSYVDTGMFSGVKPPLFLPFIKTQKLASKIVHALRTDQEFLFYPFFLKWIISLRGLLPVFLWNRIFRGMKVQHGMKTWTGRGKN